LAVGNFRIVAAEPQLRDWRKQRAEELKGIPTWLSRRAQRARIVLSYDKAADDASNNAQPQ
jgi:hypothetical protein